VVGRLELLTEKGAALIVCIVGPALEDVTEVLAHATMRGLLWGA